MKQTFFLCSYYIQKGLLLEPFLYQKGICNQYNIKIHQQPQAPTKKYMWLFEDCLNMIHEIWCVFSAIFVPIFLLMCGMSCVLQAFFYFDAPKHPSMLHIKATGNRKQVSQGMNNTMGKAQFTYHVKWN